jgi:hypothetical protein
MNTSVVVTVFGRVRLIYRLKFTSSADTASLSKRLERVVEPVMMDIARNVNT